LGLAVWTLEEIRAEAEQRRGFTSQAAYAGGTTLTSENDYAPAQAAPSGTGLLAILLAIEWPHPTPDSRAGQRKLQLNGMSSDN